MAHRQPRELGNVFSSITNRTFVHPYPQPNPDPQPHPTLPLSISQARYKVIIRQADHF